MTATNLRTGKINTKICTKNKDKQIESLPVKVFVKKDMASNKIDGGYDKVI